MELLLAVLRDLFSNQYALFAFSVLGVVFFYLLVLFISYRSSVRARARRMVKASINDEIRPHEHSRLAEQLEELLMSVGVNTEQKRRALYAPLGRAGITNPASFVYFMLFQYVGQPILFLAGIAGLFFWATSIRPLFGMAGLQFLFIASLLLLFGVYGSRIYLANKRQKREQILERSFPDAVDLLLICVESGLSLDAALARVCSELRAAHPEMTDELNQTRLELSMLNDREQALLNLASRTHTNGFRSLVTSLLQSEKFGTNLSETLRVLSDDYRASRLLRAENKAARVPALITLPLIMCVLFPTLALIMAPAIIKIQAQGGLMGGTR